MAPPSLIKILLFGGVLGIGIGAGVAFVLWCWLDYFKIKADLKLHHSLVVRGASIDDGGEGDEDEIEEEAPIPLPENQGKIEA